MEEQLLGYISHGGTGIGGAIMAMIGYKVLWERRSIKNGDERNSLTTDVALIKNDIDHMKTDILEIKNILRK